MVRSKPDIRKQTICGERVFLAALGINQKNLAPKAGSVSGQLLSTRRTTCAKRLLELSTGLLEV
jgi:hypothetical protein